jgi:REP element-mobilizing transposase RayT
MRKTLGYMVTFTTYGTWLRGDSRGWRKNGKVFAANPGLKRIDESQMKGTTVRLRKNEKAIVREAICKKALSLGQKVLAISVWSNHVHVVVGYDGRKIEETVLIYKNAATAALRRIGFRGPVWGKGYDKRFCFDEGALRKRIEYVEGHGK